MDGMKKKTGAEVYELPYEQMLEFGKTLNRNNSHSQLLHRIRRGAKVLEFGAASGLMTRYMTEELGCSVSIIELDSVCARKADKWAEDSWVGDIETMEWASYFSSCKFDYIVFADVLEHLKDPCSVLIKAEKFLSESGRILASVPNIAHDSIVLSLWMNRFEYTDVGILDRTHIRFFTIHSIAKLFEDAGLKVVESDYTRQEMPPGSYDDVLQQYSRRHRRIIGKAFRSRPDGSVFQFIIEAESSI